MDLTQIPAKVFCSERSRWSLVTQPGLGSLLFLLTLSNNRSLAPPPLLPQTIFPSCSLENKDIGFPCCDFLGFWLAVFKGYLLGWWTEKGRKCLHQGEVLSQCSQLAGRNPHPIPHPFFVFFFFLTLVFTHTMPPNHSLPSLHSFLFSSHLPSPEIHCTSVVLQKSAGLPKISNKHVIASYTKTTKQPRGGRGSQEQTKESESMPARTVWSPTPILSWQP